MQSKMRIAYIYIRVFENIFKKYFLSLKTVFEKEIRS